MWTWKRLSPAPLPPLLAVTLLGSASGLPLVLAGSALQAWMKAEGVDLAWIGLFALTGLPYSLKFLWSPLLDRYRPPFGGRRRGWILVTTLAVLACILLMTLCHPARSLRPLALLAFLIAFFSASADINIDAFRVESLPAASAGLGANLHFTSLRITMLLASSGALWLSGRMSWPLVFGLLALGMLPGAWAALLSREPGASAPPASLREAVAGPFRAFFGRRRALEILAFILIFKLGDSLAVSLNIPFLLDRGFTPGEIALATQRLGLGALVGGGLAGAVLLGRVPLRGVLWILGGLQVGGVLLTAALARQGPAPALLYTVLVLENSLFSMGTVALLALIQRLCDPGRAATQFAFLASLNALARVLFAAPAGLLARSLGWPGFFLFCAALNLGGLALLARYPRWEVNEGRPVREPGADVFTPGDCS